MKVKQFRYGGDGNLSYLVWSGTEAAAVDGGAVDEIIEFAGSEGLELKYVLNTHEHWDHIPGNEGLLAGTNAVNISPDAMCRVKLLKLGEEQLEAFPAPGHSEDSIVFYFADESTGCLLTGDTLFNGTVGNCYTKEYEMYFESLQKVLRFPPETKIFAGHDIFEYATGVIEQIDPDNTRLAEYKALYSGELLVTSLEMELAVNPFIRFDDPTLDAYRTDVASKEGLPLDTSFDRWRAMMTIH